MDFLSSQFNVMINDYKNPNPLTPVSQALTFNNQVRVYVKPIQAKNYGNEFINANNIPMNRCE